MFIKKNCFLKIVPGTLLRPRSETRMDKGIELRRDRESDSDSETCGVCPTRMHENMKDEK